MPPVRIPRTLTVLGGDPFPSSRPRFNARSCRIRVAARMGENSKSQRPVDNRIIQVHTSRVKAQRRVNIAHHIPPNITLLRVATKTGLPNITSLRHFTGKWNGAKTGGNASLLSRNRGSAELANMTRKYVHTVKTANTQICVTRMMTCKYVNNAVGTQKGSTLSTRYTTQRSKNAWARVPGSR